MSIFKRKQKDFLGIDFGAAGIKIVQFRKINDRPQLFTYGFADFSQEEIGKDYLENSEAAGKLLKEICKKARVTTNEAVAALPIPSVFSSVLSIAEVPKKELRQAVEWEAKKLIPLPLEEVALDYKELHFDVDGALKEVTNIGEGVSGAPAAVPEAGKSKSERTTQILLTAAPKSIVNKYLAVAKSAGLVFKSIETESFSLVRSMLGFDPAPAVILDFGAVRSNILIIDHGVPMLTRSIEIGGKKCTAALAQQLSISMDQAEAMKKDLDDPNQLPPIMREVLQPLVNELKYSFTVYKARALSARQPDRLILTGGGAAISGLPEFLSAEFNLRAFIGNPWDHVSFHKDLSPTLQSIGSRFSVAIGLALRNL